MLVSSLLLSGFLFVLFNLIQKEYGSCYEFSGFNTVCRGKITNLLENDKEMIGKKGKL